MTKNAVPADFQAITSGPFFSLGIRCNGDELTEILYLPDRLQQAASTPLAAEAVRQIQAYLADPAFIFSLPLQPSGTRFQRRVWDAIAAIPQGQTQSYGEVAKLLHSGPRAVGGACGANPFPLAVPCHRVIAAAGLGGFGRNGGDFLLDIKRWLLQHEGCLPA